MNIGIVCPYSFDEPGGVQAHILDLAQVLIQRGHSVSVLGPCSAHTEVPDFVCKGGPSIPVPYNGSVARISLRPATFKRTREFIQQGNFDVLHIHEPNSPSFSMAALRIAEGPIVATYHASSSGSRLLKLLLPVLRGPLEKVRGGIAVSEMARRWQVEMLGGDPVLIPNGVDTHAFAQYRNETCSDDVSEIVFLGRIDESRKGLPVLLKALDGLDRNVQVTVIGAGQPRPHPQVRYVGRVSDEEKAKILGRADIYVAPNLGGESFGIVLVEAMAAGCAVVASDLEAFAAVCDAESEQPAGALFSTGDPDALRRILQTLIDQPAQCEALVHSGEKRAELYDWQTVADEVERVYETVADGTKVQA
ncbi:glycosyltransferase family 4 protein [Corynebacterium pseudopelargi]|uniref:GDP-mannose-dependent alpha-(1-2)-phosphatidylinositol mannosyltransferase n=1 Tax=Corynebacterium pseudopelargi TaxID=2080757 RepID=A0A3G6IU99_9CORY|nr:glycosyltransferase family 4 protein [Corynebacterium pseudopelargi]AZA09147.1 GDP-mannose-dependent alpha-(1-2)-phosphatidylinositol mannosyltransferase [Corynebacterium pseudopelargi]